MKRSLISRFASCLVVGSAFAACPTGRADETPADGPATTSVAAPIPHTLPGMNPSAPAIRVEAAPLGLPSEAACPVETHAPEWLPPAKSSRGWASVDFLLWQVSQDRIPIPLATTGTAASFGSLAIPGTRTVLGASNIDYGTQGGVRVTAGLWLDDDRCYGFEVSAIILEQKSFEQGVGGLPVLARPFIDTRTNTDLVRSLSQPGLSTGAVGLTATTDFWTGEANFLTRLSEDESGTFDVLTGFRYAELYEVLSVYDRAAVSQGNVVSLGGLNFASPGVSSVTDTVVAHNAFYGAQLGGRFTRNSGRFSVGADAKVALGIVHQVTNLSGYSTLSGVAAAPLTVQSGFLATGTNSRRQASDEFGIMPEGALRVGYRVTDRIAFTAGYNVLYLNSVVRPGQQFDRTINPTFVPTAGAFGTVFGPRSPMSKFETTDFFAHGVSLGLSLKY